MKAWTDYPFTSLGDEPYKKAPIREIIIVHYDQDKYVDIIVEGIEENIKAGYCYTEPGRHGEVPSVNTKDLPITRLKND